MRAHLMMVSAKAAAGVLKRTQPATAIDSSVCFRPSTAAVAAANVFASHDLASAEKVVCQACSGGT